MNKKVYIIIPCYNVENYLRKCLDSVFNQTYKNIEVICVNDGSSDNTLKLLTEYTNKYKNMVLIEQENKGVSAARNAALDKINYNHDTYLLFIDADDWVDRTYIETLIGLIEAKNVDIVCSSFIFAHNGVNKSFKHIESDSILTNVNASEKLLRDESIQSHSVSKLFKTRLWKNIRYNESLFYMEDQEVIFKTFYIANLVFVTNYAGYYYRQDNVNASTKNGIGTKKAISGIKGYYNPCFYKFDSNCRDVLLSSAQHGLVGAYLMLVPYVNKKELNKEQISFLKEVKKYLKKNKCIKKYVPTSKNSRIKRALYRLCPPLYSFFFKVAKRVMA